MNQPALDMEKIADGTASPVPIETEIPDWFDDESYLLVNPDVQPSIASGAFSSGYDHYLKYGRQEGRPLFDTAHGPKNRLVRSHKLLNETKTSAEPRASFEFLMLSPGGGVLLVGWVDDAEARLEWVTVSGRGWYITLSDSRLVRVRRHDVEVALGSNRAHPFGFYAFAYAGESFDAGGIGRTLLHLNDGREITAEIPARRVSEAELRDTLFGYIAGSDFFGNRQVESIRALDGPLSAAIVAQNRDLSSAIVRGAYVERFGPRTKKPRGTMVICLFGKPEYLFLQSALFSGGEGFDDFEMIYVSNSPEMSEQLLKDLHTGEQIYGIPQTAVLLPGNAGFGAANNIAVAHASSDRVVIVNPDVFPRDHDWAKKHTQLVEHLPRAQTQLFGVPLFYEDGSLMHGGMYFEYDTGLSVLTTTMSARRLARVEHYGKGTPAWSDQFTRSRPVPAVTGAFISLARSWYEKLGGFTEDYVFGHYEDADLCLKSLSAGVAPWIQDIKLWHLEGKGSTRLAVHEGGSVVNRSLFAQRWDKFIASGVEGPTPTHPLLQAPSGPLSFGR